MIPIETGTVADSNSDNFMCGWVVGHMHNGLRHSPHFEIKQWRYDGPIDYGKKMFGGEGEYVIIFGGILRFDMEREIDGKLQTLQSLFLNGALREYVILPPGITKTVVVAEAPAYGVTVRWPSRPELNQVVHK